LKRFNYDNFSTYGHDINIKTENPTRQRKTLIAGDTDPRAPSKSESIIGSSDWLTWVGTAYPASLTAYNTNGVFSINEMCENRGFLFYNTAENLPAYYSLSYNTTKDNDDMSNRFVYKIDLETKGLNTAVPKVRSIRFEINKDI
jgi:hypothetical protein